MTNAFCHQRVCTAAVLVASIGPLAGSASAVQITGICRVSAAQIVTSADPESCGVGFGVMRDWQKAGKPKRFRFFTCGKVPGFNVGFARNKRWFATYECATGSAKYQVWTRY